MVFDLHVHTRYGSADSYIDYTELVPYAKQAKLDGICITEHGYEKTGITERFPPERDFLILEGIEFTTELGDILIFGVESIPKNLILRERQLRKFVLREGGVMFLAHPFRLEITRMIKRGQTPRVRPRDVVDRPIFGLVDGLEIANGLSVPEDVAFCRVVCKQMGLKGIGGSDAHVANRIGACVTVFENSIHSEADFIAELKNGTFHAEDRR
jgi:predicted metal-dependent phosphoesterase TrpH